MKRVESEKEDETPSRKLVKTAREQIGAHALKGIITICMMHVEKGVMETEKARADRAEAELAASKDFRQKAYYAEEILQCILCNAVYKDFTTNPSSKCGHCNGYRNICGYGFCESHLAGIGYGDNKATEVAKGYWCDKCERPCCWRITPTECKRE